MGRQARVVGVEGGVASGVVVEEPQHRRVLEEVALPVVGARGVVARTWVAGQISTCAPTRSGSSWAATAERLPPGAVAADREQVAPTELGLVVGRPPHRRQRVLDGCRVRRLRSQPVVDGEHHGVGAAADPPAGLVVGVEVADHEPAAVQEDQRRPRAGTLRAVDAGRASGHGEVLDRPDRHLLAVARRPAAPGSRGGHPPACSRGSADVRSSRSGRAEPRSRGRVAYDEPSRRGSGARPRPALRRTPPARQGSSSAAPRGRCACCRARPSPSARRRG